MSDLYTSLTQLKMAMNGGELPPTMALSDTAAKYLDPAATIGMGGIMEDERRGLACPVKGCGFWGHSLAPHLTNKHGNIGGSIGVREMLDIPRNAPLVSGALRDRLRAVHANDPGDPNLMPRHFKRGSARAKRHGAAVRRHTLSIGSRNLRDTCDAQLGAKMLWLADKVGRSPTAMDARVHVGAKFLSACESHFGSWNAAKAYVRLRAADPKEYNVKRLHQEDVLTCLDAFYQQMGRLPTATEAQTTDIRRGIGGVALPSYKPILRVFNADSWAQAMESARFLLGIEPAKATA